MENAALKRVIKRCWKIRYGSVDDFPSEKRKTPPAGSFEGAFPAGHV